MFLITSILMQKSGKKTPNLIKEENEVGLNKGMLTIIINNEFI